MDLRLPTLLALRPAIDRAIEKLGGERP